MPMLHDRFAGSAIERISAEDLDGIAPHLDGPTVDDLTFRLSGFEGARLELECVNLADAMLEDMRGQGHAMGRLEHTLVLALLRAAVDKLAVMEIGRA